MIILPQFSLPYLYILSLRGWENVLFDLWSEGVNKLLFSPSSEYLSDSATAPINVDCKTREEVELNLKKPGRYMFDAAQVSYAGLCQAFPAVAGLDKTRER